MAGINPYDPYGLTEAPKAAFNFLAGPLIKRGRRYVDRQAGIAADNVGNATNGAIDAVQGVTNNAISGVQNAVEPYMPYVNAAAIGARDSLRNWVNRASFRLLGGGSGSPSAGSQQFVGPPAPSGQPAPTLPPPVVYGPDKPSGPNYGLINDYAASERRAARADAAQSYGNAIRRNYSLQGRKFIGSTEKNPTTTTTTPLERQRLRRVLGSDNISPQDEQFLTSLEGRATDQAALQDYAREQSNTQRRVASRLPAAESEAQLAAVEARRSGYEAVAANQEINANTARRVSEQDAARAAGIAEGTSTIPAGPDGRVDPEYAAGISTEASAYLDNIAGAFNSMLSGTVTERNVPRQAIRQFLNKINPIFTAAGSSDPSQAAAAKELAGQIFAGVPQNAIDKPDVIRFGLDAAGTTFLAHPFANIKGLIKSIGAGSVYTDSTEIDQLYAALDRLEQIAGVGQNADGGQAAGQ